MITAFERLFNWWSLPSGTPTHKKLKTVIDTLGSIREVADRVGVDMDRVLVDPACRASSCHGGWYGIARGCQSVFDKGVDRMAHDLGFRGRHDLTTWAEENPDLWGNRYGEWMFGLEIAFGCTRDTITMTKIINHWIGVNNRCHPHDQLELIED